MRTTISLDDGVAKLAEKVAAKESRNFSNLCEVALKEYCGDRDPEDHSRLIAAVDDVGGVEKAVAVLKKAARKTKVAA